MAPAIGNSAVSSNRASAPDQVSSPPDQPLVVIEPSRYWVPLDLRGLWAYRELLYFLTWRDVKVRYKQTLLGAAWAIIQPLLTMIICSLLFARMPGIKSEDMPYPIFAYAGLLPWTFFANAVTASGNSLVGSSSLITKIYFPRIIIPSAAVAAGLVDFALSFLVLIPLMFYYRVQLTPNLLFLPLMIMLVTGLALAIGMWMSALNVKYRDIRYALPFVIQLWFFASPIIYSASVLRGKLKIVLMLNPLTGIIENFRSALVGREMKWTSLAFSAAMTLALLVWSAYAFRRMEKTFADLV
ncbi:MAG TPA: ABC transporter permease [Pyrinomonadaceae bacterium]|nr:ABC transporter permease [Pyrinomonadaceae bacterium]